MEYRVEKSDGYYYVELYDGERYVAQVDSFITPKQANKIAKALNRALEIGREAGRLEVLDPLEASYRKFDELNHKRSGSTMDVYDGNGFPLDTD